MLKSNEQNSSIQMYLFEIWMLLIMVILKTVKLEYTTIKDTIEFELILKGARVLT